MWSCNFSSCGLILCKKPTQKSTPTILNITLILVRTYSFSKGPLSFLKWQSLIKHRIASHFRIFRSGSFVHKIKASIKTFRSLKFYNGAKWTGLCRAFIWLDKKQVVILHSHDIFVHKNPLFFDIYLSKQQNNKNVFTIWHPKIVRHSCETELNDTWSLSMKLFFNEIVNKGSVAATWNILRKKADNR